MKKILYLIPALLLFAACNKTAKEPASEGTEPVVVDLPQADGPLDEIGVETLATGDVQSLNNVNFKVKVSNKAVPTECGIAYSTNLTDLKRKIAWRKKAEVTKSGEVSIKLDLLYSGTTYYYAAYSIYEGSCYHGEVKSLTTPKAAVGNAVFLGLSVDWSDRNLGASSPTGVGNFYCWADVNPAGRTSVFSKSLNMSDITGTEYDAVKQTWGGRWRLPTQKEMEELAWKCNWELVTLEGKQLFKVTPKIDYASKPYIYIPLCELEYVGKDNARDEYYPIIKKDAESVYLMTGTQVEKADWNPYVMNGDEMKWCYALDYYIIDFENEKRPSVGILNSKSSIYSIRPVYVPEVIN